MRELGVIVSLRIAHAVTWMSYIIVTLKFDIGHFNTKEILRIATSLIKIQAETAR